MLELTCRTVTSRVGEIMLTCRWRHALSIAVDPRDGCPHNQRCWRALHAILTGSGARVPRSDGRQMYTWASILSCQYCRNGSSPSRDYFPSNLNAPNVELHLHLLAVQVAKHTDGDEQHRVERNTRDPLRGDSYR